MTLTFIENELNFIDTIQLIIFAVICLALGYFIISRVVLFVQRTVINNYRQRCWHCGHNQWILSKEQRYKWHCPNCLDWNVLNDDYEPLDYLPEEVGHSPKVSTEKHMETPQRNHISTTQNGLRLCESCQEDQNRKVQLLSTFDPNVPNEKMFNVAADAYARELENRYPLCPDCETTVRIALASSSRMVLNDQLTRRLYQSKVDLMRQNPSAFKLRIPFMVSFRLTWYLMTLLRRMGHLMYWGFYISVLVSSQEQLNSFVLQMISQLLQKSHEYQIVQIRFKYLWLINYAFMISLISGFYSPLKASSAAEKEKLKRSLRGKPAYLLLRLALLVLRGAVVFSSGWKNDKVDNPFLVVAALVLDIGLVFISRNVLRVSKDTITLKKVSEYVRNSSFQVESFQSQEDIHRRSPVQESRTFADRNVFNLSLDGEEEDEENSYKQFVHPFQVDTSRTKFGSPIPQAFSSTSSFNSTGNSSSMFRTANASASSLKQRRKNHVEFSSPKFHLKEVLFIFRSS